MRYIFLLVFIMVVYTNGFSICKMGNCENGRGIFYFENDSKNKYIGEFKNGLPHGHGIRHFSNGKYVEGYWEKGKMLANSSGLKGFWSFEKTNLTYIITLVGIVIGILANVLNIRFHILHWFETSRNRFRGDEYV